MKLTSTFLKNVFAAFLLLSSFAAFAQTSSDSCTFRLLIYDRFGDDWDASELSVRIGSNSQSYTHINRIAGAGDSSQFYDIRVRVGDSIVLTYTPQGNFQGEIKYALYNNAGETVFADGPTPAAGVSFRGRVQCLRCGGAIQPNVRSVRASNAIISWKPAQIGSFPTYLVEWDTAAYVAGRARNNFSTTDTFIVIQGLRETTNYEAYIRTACQSPTDSSRRIGAVTWKTDTAVNVGVVAIEGPKSACTMGASYIKLKIKNFGGDPANLIDYRMSVNGVPLSIPYPADGLWTGVLTKDSITTVEFKTPVDFSADGDYELAAWTVVPGDRNIRNDTAYLVVTHPKTVVGLPYFENFETSRGTWYVADSSIAKNATWAYGTPAGAFIVGAGNGSRAWTNGLTTAYNNNEINYLFSPCYNFSSLTADPRISFKLNFYTENRYDGSWLEASNDGGTTWRTIGTRTSTGGINWYTDTVIGRQPRQDMWTGITRRGWRNAAHTLTGVAGQSNVRLRIAFRSDGSGNTTFDGVAIDDILIQRAQTTDLAAENMERAGITECGSTTDTMVIRITNMGTTTQSRYSVGYSVNGGVFVVENIDSLNLPAGATALYRFRTPFNSAIPGNSTIRGFVRLAGDTLALNDSTTATFSIALPVSGSLSQNFDNAVLPPRWLATRATFGRGVHGNATTNGVAYSNIWGSATARTFNVTTNLFGPVRLGDSLKYDYRFVNEDAPYDAYDMSNNDTFKLQVAFDCDPVFTTLEVLNASNHDTTRAYRTRGISLSSLVGRNARFRFLVTSTITDFTGYFFDLDNVNYKSACPATFISGSTITNANPGQSNGRIALTVSGGQLPYTYRWSTGAVTNTITNLAQGNYTVTVADARGCEEIRTFSVRSTTVYEANSAIGKISLSPNPTSGIANLDLEMNRAADVNIQIFNLVGQQVGQEIREKAVTKAQYNLDLSAQPAGMYLIRITAENKTYVTRLVKQQ
jgi:hypothetical protein